MKIEIPAFTTAREVLAFGETLCNNECGVNNNHVVGELDVKLCAVSGVASKEDALECYQPILHFIEHCPTLTSVNLDGNYMDGMEAPRTTVSLFLDAISKNASITKIAINLCKTSADRFKNLMLEGNIQDLEIKWCFWGRSEGEADVVADAFRMNTTLERVKLDRVGHKFVTSIVAALAEHSKLQYLSVHAEGANTPIASSPATIQQSLRELTKNSKTLQHLELNAFRLQSEVFAPIVEGLLESKSVTCLSFDSCSFFRRSSGSIGRLLHTMRNTDNAATTTTTDETKIKSVGLLMAELLLSNKTITVLDMSKSNHIFCKEDFARIVDAIAESKTLKRFQYGCIHDSTLCEIILNRIPKMQFLPTLQLELDPSIEPLTNKILEAFRANSTLTDIVVKSNQVEFFKTKHQEQLKNYMLRNENVPKFLSASFCNDDKSATLPRVLHKVLDSKENATSTIFQGLMKLSGQEMKQEVMQPVKTIPYSKLSSDFVQHVMVPRTNPVQTTYVSRVA